MMNVDKEENDVLQDLSLQALVELLGILMYDYRLPVEELLLYISSNERTRMIYTEDMAMAYLLRDDGDIEELAEGIKEGMLSGK
jgi:hypothetical protein